ncbi:MAG: hypothetical protein QMD13_02990 [Candidatus Bathyarchaeia archaeon]|nr:hypothetical protein [Candidatus Bathyarchaeia archaeon]
MEAPRKLNAKELEKLSTTLFHLSDGDVEKSFCDYLEARFPFSYKMKFVAERFGALPRGKTILNPDRLKQLLERFRKTPIFDETLREAMLEKVDIKQVKKLMKGIKSGRIKVSAIHRLEKPTPLAYHILAKYSDISELMAPERVLLSNLERMKRAIEARTATLLCMSCGKWTTQKKIRSLSEQPSCKECKSKLLALIRPNQNPSVIRGILKKRLGDKELTEEELENLTHARRTADLVLSYGKKAIIALEVKGVGPETAFRILGKMHQKEDDFYMDLLKAKIQYLRTREYWENKEDRVKGFSFK